MGMATKSALLRCALLSSAFLSSRRPPFAEASRAYPHGCLYRHPSYYTYDERDDASWTSSSGGGRHDFRRLPPPSSGLRRPHGRYRLTRRLGAGKFSEVFEAVDVQHLRRERRKKRRARAIAGEDESSTGGETTDGSCDDDEMMEDGVTTTITDPASLVVLKCLKPVTERKVRRELLVLTHCVALPNLARVIGIVLPDEADGGEDDDDDGEEEEGGERRTAGHRSIAASSSGAHPRRRHRRQHGGTVQRRLQREDIGSITEAAASCASAELARRDDKKAKTTMSRGKENGSAEGSSGARRGTQLPALVLEHAGRDSQWLCHPTNGADHLTEYEIKYYLCHLLLALDGLHAAGIMHRDVKPRNTLVNRRRDDDDRGKGQRRDPRSPPPLVLVDLGLADFYLPGTKYNVRVASRHYKSPELLIGHGHYDYAVDLWSVGCMLAGLLFRKEPFFKGKDNEDQLGRIVSVLGTRDFLPYCRKCDARLTKGMRAAIGKYCSRAAGEEEEEAKPSSLLDDAMGRRIPWMDFVSDECPIPSAEALDLLDRLLVYDQEQRWTAREALGHAFFDEVRERVVGEARERMAWEESYDRRRSY